MSFNFVTFQSDSVGSVRVLADETPPQITGGYGGWDVVSRPRKKGLTQWNGKDPIRMQIAVLFDGWKKRASQEIAISRLSRMALPPEGGHGEPPKVSVGGPGVPRPGPNVWVIESLSWGTNVLWGFARDGSMTRLRQDCVVNLLEYVDEDRVAFSGLGTQPAGPQPGRTLMAFRVREGDSLSGIASQLYGDSTKWTTIADNNNIRDPDALVPGQTLYIPV